MTLSSKANQSNASSLEDNEHYRLLGMDGARVVVYSKPSGMIMRFTREQMLQPATLISMAPEVWWCALTGAPEVGVKMSRQSGDALIRAADKLGLRDVITFQTVVTCDECGESATFTGRDIMGAPAAWLKRHLREPHPSTPLTAPGPHPSTPLTAPGPEPWKVTTAMWDENGDVAYVLEGRKLAGSLDSRVVGAAWDSLLALELVVGELWVNRDFLPIKPGTLESALAAIAKARGEAT